MAPVNMPSQSVQLRQQVILGSNTLPQKHKQGKRYGRRPVRTAGGEKLLAGRRHRAASGNGVFEERIEDIINDVIEADELGSDWEEDVDQPSKPRTPELKAKEPKEVPEANPEPDFPPLNEDGRKERTLSEMSAGSYTEVLQRKSSEDAIYVGSPKASPKKSSLTNIAEELQDVWMMVGSGGKVVPESLVGKAAVTPPKRMEAPVQDVEADPYDALEVKDNRRKPHNGWRPMGDAHTGRRYWKVDPSERERCIEAAQLKKRLMKQGAQQPEEGTDEDDGTEEKKRTRLDRKMDARRAKAEINDAESTTSEDSEQEKSTDGKKPHTKKLRKRLLSK